MNKGLYSSKTGEWETPWDLFDELNDEFHFTLDVCATRENTKCKKYYTKRDDGLSKNWEKEICFMNPPYGREISRWVEKAFVQPKDMGESVVVALLPARTDTKWFHDWIYERGFEIRFIKGRIKFSESKNSAPFPSMIVIFK